MARSIVAALLIAGLAGCSQQTPPQKAARSPERIVSLAPNLTELLFAVGAGHAVVGVTKNDTYPAQVKRLPQVGDMAVDYEGLLRLRPDLVVVDANLNRSHIPRLQQLGLPLETLESASFAGMKQAIRDLGKRTGHSREAEEQLRRLEEAVQAAQARSGKWKRKPSVFLEVNLEPLITAGKGTYVDEVLTAAGLSNVYADRNSYPALSLEELLHRDPDMIVLTTAHAEALKERPGWSSVRAVRRGNVHRVPEDLLVRPTPRVAEALTLLQDWAEAL